ncbi:hypothetical protein SORBI_3001G472050 [Sorghum bicolor]|uniref:Uncharacterized protein n=1 Tax=Sorghum bicolor TaxID=4558 RepID=A0A1Z5SB08_SORBI|nr:hypothetical protein SORBI_3001G472050 [Sorghum bicolor]
MHGSKPLIVVVPRSALYLLFNTCCVHHHIVHLSGKHISRSSFISSSPFTIPATHAHHCPTARPVIIGS